jgi:hypothetical protein
MKKPNGYWTKERCREEALKYETRKDFQIGNVSAYNSSRKLKCLEEVCSHMKFVRNVNNYWTKDRCEEESLKYNDLSEFRDVSKTAHKEIYRNKWDKELLKHMNRDKKPCNYWTKEKCQEESLKYKSRSEFQKGTPRAYIVSRLNGWLDEFCSHMKVVGNRMKRCIYSYEFEDKHVYVGLTYNIEIRHDRHLKKGTVYNYIIKSNITPKLIKLTKYIDVNVAKIKEGEYVEKYKNNGWNILNKTKTGGIGNVPKWTKEKCHKEALKYNNKRDFRMSSNTYNVAHKNGWVDEICSHMEELIKPKNYWTKEKCKEEALKYKTKQDFRRGCSSAYNNSYANDWLDNFCSHMKEIKKPSGYWTKEKCREESLKYITRGEFRKYSGSAYVKCLKEKWLNEFFPKQN